MRHGSGGVAAPFNSGTFSASLAYPSYPLDAMVYEMKKVTGFPRERVLGMAGTLDCARFQCFLAEAAGCSVKDRFFP